MARVVIVSNRLPVTIKPDQQPPDDVQSSSGGLVSALRTIAGAYDEVLWVGWPGTYCSNEAEEQRMTQRLHEVSNAPGCIQMHPVWLSKDDVEDFYNGFSNSSLWPLLHWMTPYARFRKSWTESYRRVNLLFAKTTLAVAKETDVIWFHDYHLFLAPQMLRQLVTAKLEASDPSAGSAAPRPKDLSHSSPCTDDFSEQEDVYFQNSEDHRTAFKSIGSQSSLAIPPPTPGASVEIAKFKSPKRVSFTQSDRSAAKTRTAWESLKVGFFLHTPFPSYEVFSTLPICTDIVEGMLGADLIGFHTYNYLRHYRSCVLRVCGLSPEMDMVEYEGRRSRLGVFPIGANCSDIQELMKSEKFVEHLQTYTDNFQGQSLVLSVERLDYSKGMPQKLAAIEQYLEEAAAEQAAKKRRQQQEPNQQPEDRARTPGQDERETRLEELAKRFEDRLAQGKPNHKRDFRTAITHYWNKAWAGTAAEDADEVLDHTKTVFVFVAVPSRQTVREYKEIEEEVHREISAINGRFGTVGRMPIHYIHRSISGEELAALYARADCCLVTPLVDGMNLVAKEYVAAKDPSIDNVVPGTIVLSEFAGACQEMFDALVVNPYHIDAVTDAIRLGLELTRGAGLDGRSRWEPTARMRQSILENDAAVWAKRFLEDLLTDPKIGQTTQRGGPMIGMFAQDFGRSVPGKKAIFLNFDGSVSAGTGKDRLPDFLADMLAQLAERDDLLVCIVSGQTKEFVDRLFGQYVSFVCIAEHGICVRRAGVDLWQQMLQDHRDDSVSWMKKVLPLLQLFQRCTPDARLDLRASSIAWHYDQCDEDYASFKTKELVHQLAYSTGNMPCEVCQGDNVVEVKSLHVKNSFAVQAVLSEMEHTHGDISAIFILSDDTTDELMFAPIADHSPYSARVGRRDSDAKFCFDDWAKVSEYFDKFLKPSAGHEGEDGKESGRFESCNPYDRTESLADDDAILGLGFDERDER